MEDERTDSGVDIRSGARLLAELSSSLSLDMAALRIETARKRDYSGR
jgi:hypothetical protein